MGLVMEMVQEISPCDVKAGAPLQVRILSQGERATNMQVENSWMRAGSRQPTIIGRAYELPTRKTSPHEDNTMHIAP